MPDPRVEELRGAFEVRLTNDLRRIDYAALFDANRKFLFGNIETLPALPLDGTSHFIAAAPVPGSDTRLEPAIFVARVRPEGMGVEWRELAPHIVDDLMVFATASRQPRSTAPEPLAAVLNTVPGKTQIG